jgi:hypothetical protein
MIDIEQRLAANLEAVMGQVLAPPRSRVERALIAVHVPERWARLMSATPTLRWSWAIALGAVLLFAASAGGADWDSADRVAILLALAPLAPVVAVAAAYGPGVDRSHQVMLVAPLSGLRLLLLRSVTVVAMAAALTALAALAAPSGGWLRVAWLLPSLATTAATLAVGARVGLQRAAIGVGAVWLALVIVVGESTDDAVAAFRLPAQIAAAVVATAAAGALYAERRRLDRWAS